MRTVPLTDFGGFIQRLGELLEKIGQFVMTFALVLVIAAAALAVYSLFNYILRSAAIVRIARRRRIKGWGLAWVPLIYTAVLGAIADRHDCDNSGERTGLKVFLPVMTGIAIVLNGLSACLYAVDTRSLPLCVTLLALSVPAVPAVFVFKYVAVYKTVESCCPKHTLWVMFIYTFVPFAKPFVLVFVAGADAYPAEKRRVAPFAPGKMGAGTGELSGLGEKPDAEPEKEHVAESADCIPAAESTENATDGAGFLPAATENTDDLEG